MHADTAPAARLAPDRTSPLSLLPWIATGVLVAFLTARPGQAQQPTPTQVQQALSQQPGLADQLRQRIAQSGLSAEQVRSRLTASGYPANLLDAYMGAAAAGQLVPTPGAQELAAIQMLGLPTGPTNLLPVDTGLFVRRVAAPSAVFGVDVFRRTTTQFLPLLAGPVPADYKLGPGDQLVLILTGDVELAYQLQVTREGFILIPQVGQVFVSNLTLDQLREMLFARLGRVYSGVRKTNATTRFDISVANVRANQVYVVGEVGQPGAYQISSLGTVLTALYAAGGLTERADMRAVEVRRLSKTVATVDLYDYLLRGDTRSDIRLETGDVVFVPVHGTRVQITGAVRRPAVYELKAGETLSELIRAAGEFSSNAALKRIAVHRILPSGQRGPGPAPRAVIDVALTTGRGERGEVRPGAGEDPVLIPPVSLMDGDSVVVDSLPSLGQSYYVAIAGMVRKPGAYPWRPGMTLRELVTLARGPTVGAYLKEAEIARLPEDRSLGQLATTVRVPLDSTYLYDRDSLGRYVGPPGPPFPSGGAPEVTLQPYDNVLILRQPEFDFQRTVVIQGEVLYPGTYSLRTKTDRLAAVIARAGGLTRQAYPDGIRFVRRLDNIGRINVDLGRALRDTAASANIILQPGDSIDVPEYQPAVKVSGAVNSPGSVLYRRGADLNYYLGAAGGFAYTADKGKVSVRYANGEVRTRHHWFLATSDPKPGPGSEVLVPTRDLTQHTDYVALFGAVAQILASSVAIIVVLRR
jgi:protein involved in polysaccharide export with SLBB domain